MSERTFFFTPDAARQLYERGLQGAYYSPKDRNDLTEWLIQHGGSVTAYDACLSNGIAQSGEGKLSLGHMAAMALYPDAFPGGAQERGDCVSWSTRNAVLASYCNEILYGDNPDRLDAPVVSDVARVNGVISTESFYWWRGHGGEGWTGTGAAKVALEKSGMWLRQKYDQFGFDLTKYDVNLAGKWGSSRPPKEIEEFGQQRLVKTATFVDTWEELRDLIHNGNCVSSTGMEAWGGLRDQWGVCYRKTGTWAHAIAMIAADDRPDTVKKYGCGLVLLLNSWGEGYLSGPRAIVGTPHSIPLGTFWAKWNDVRNREMVAFSAVEGWPGRRMPGWGPEGII